MRFDVLSLFPEYFQGPLSESILKRAQENGYVQIVHTNIRDYALDRHRKVDDRLYGGGKGMLLLPGPVVDAVREKKTLESYVIAFTPKGAPLKQSHVKSFAEKKHIILLCGHYEGFDERALDLVADEQISIGDYVLTNGCLAACVFIDAVSRCVPGVLSNDAISEESFEENLLECPHYTRPEVFEGKSVPEILLEGDHKKIREWRLQEAIAITKKRRPDLYNTWLSKEKETPGEVEVYVTQSVWSVSNIRKTFQFYKMLFPKEKLYLDSSSLIIQLKNIRIRCVQTGEPSQATLQVSLNSKDFKKIVFYIQRGIVPGEIISHTGENPICVLKDPDQNSWFFSIYENDTSQ